MTMIKISLSPAPSPSPEEARAPRGRTAGGWGAEGAGPGRRAPGRVLAEPRGTQAPSSGTHGWGARGGKEVLVVGNGAFFVAERGRRGRAELIATLILCPEAQPSPEPGVARARPLALAAPE